MTQTYNLQKDGRELIWLELELVINAPDDSDLFMTPLGKGILIRQQIALFADENPEINAQIIANVSTELIKRAVVVRSRVLELDENGNEVK